MLSEAGEKTNVIVGYMAYSPVKSTLTWEWRAYIFVGMHVT